jgi:hypothetical protein
MKTSDNKNLDEKYIGTAINGLGFITGLFLYVPFYLLSYIDSTDKEYFGNDLTVLFLSIFIILIVGFIWFRIYKQFKKDKTKLGFPPEKKGTTLILTVIIESSISIFTIMLLT